MHRFRQKHSYPSRSRSRSSTPSSSSYSFGTSKPRTTTARGRSESLAPSTADSTSTTTTSSTTTRGGRGGGRRGAGGGRGTGFGNHARFAKGSWGRGGRASSTAPSRSTRAESVLSNSDSRTIRSSNNSRSDEIDELDGDDLDDSGNIRLVASDEEWVSCITESKGAGMRTVGIAAFQPSTASCILTQLNDSQTYIKTVHTLSVRWPSIILTPGIPGLSGARIKGHDPSTKSKVEETLLLKSLQSTFGRSFPNNNNRDDDMVDGTGLSTGSRTGSAAPGYDAPGGGAGSAGVEITGISRRFFDAKAGEDFIGELILNDDETAGCLAALNGKYYALSAAAALFKFLEMNRNCIFAPGSLMIKYAPLEGTMLIDGETVKNLELVENMMDRKSKQSLYGFLNHCFTPMAARLLRTNILSPLTDAATIDIRLDVVAELINSEERFRNLRRALKTLERIDADKITGSILAFTSLSTNVKSRNRKNLDPAKESEKKLTLMLQLRTFIKGLPNVRAALMDEGGCGSSMLDTIAKILGDERLQAIEDEIANTLNEGILSSMTKTALAARTSRVFAIKAERKKLLDVARETYKENITDVDELLKDLQAKYPDILDDVELNYNASSGFTFTLHEDILEEKGGELPRIFNRLSKRGKKVVFSCVDLLKRNQRIQQSLDEVFLLSSDVLDELFVAIRVHIAALYRCSEVIGMLDMLASFAHVATTSASYTRPEFTDTLAIKDGRHPVLERYKFSDGAFVPNDTYATDAASFQLLTGPNMSGKTTFLKQIALLVVMGQIGCYVPAEYASFRLHGALLTRLSNDDSIEGNLSTFALEMKTMGMILSGLSTCENSLVIVDELGRGTSPQEGVGIAHAIAEEIIRSKAFCFFATHFHDLSVTLSMYPNVVSLHLETDMAPPTAPQGRGYHDPIAAIKDFSMTFSHRVRDGCVTSQNYGLEIAKVAALPDLMMLEARAATTRLMDLQELRKRDAVGTKVANKRKTILDTAAHLKQAFRSSRLDNDELAEYTRKIMDEAVLKLTEDLQDEPAEDEVQEDAEGSLIQEENQESDVEESQPEVRNGARAATRSPSIEYARSLGPSSPPFSPKPSFGPSSPPFVSQLSFGDSPSSPSSLPTRTEGAPSAYDRFYANSSGPAFSSQPIEEDQRTEPYDENSDDEEMSQAGAIRGTQASSALSLDDNVQAQASQATLV